jgi:hypothetical protein
MYRRPTHRHRSGLFTQRRALIGVGNTLGRKHRTCGGHQADEGD